MTEKKHTLFLDGLRAIACLAVIIYHTSTITLDSHNNYPDLNTESFIKAFMLQWNSGVTLFLILSGFLLFLPYARALISQKALPSAKTFYLKRIFRTWPGYFFSLVVLLLWQAPDYLQPQNWRKLVLLLTFFMDINVQKVNGPYWTLAVEWQFYFALPLVVLCFAWVIGRFAPKRRHYVLLTLLLINIVWHLLARIWGHYYHDEHKDGTVLVPRSILHVILFFTYGDWGKFFEDIGIGMLVAYLYVWGQQSLAERKEGQWNLGSCFQKWSYAFWIVGLLTMLAVAVWGGCLKTNLNMGSLGKIFGWENYILFSEFVIACGAGLLILALLFGPSWLRRPLEWKPLLWIGMISYSLYIWHLPFLRLWAWIWNNQLHLLPSIWLPVSLVAVIMVVIMPLCWLIYKVIEEPWMNLGKRFLKKRAEPTFVGAVKEV